ncbi:MAG TPA: hypothetical protein VHJ79_18865 [Mycobacterium sp.]|nr:hypothetical protein [Mycobacterium sp.]
MRPCAPVGADLRPADGVLLSYHHTVGLFIWHLGGGVPRVDIPPWRQGSNRHLALRAVDFGLAAGIVIPAAWSARDRVR